MKLTANPALGLFHVWVGSSGAKLVRVMKLTTIIILAVCLQSSANGLAQNTVTFSGKDVNLESVFTAIKKQTSYRFFFNTTIIQNASKITIEVKNAPIEQVMNLALKDQSLTFAIKGRTIFVMKKPEEEHKTSFIGLPLNPIDVKGRMVNEKGEPIEGVSITIKGTSITTVTNANGEFTLNNVEHNAVLIISHVQYESQMISLNGKSMVSIALQTKVSALDELQIIAYGTTTKRFNTGNISSVKTNDIAKQPVNNPLLALQGRVPGLFIQQATGVPGGGVGVRIQGTGSIRSGNSPLIVIDGVPYTSQLLPNLGASILNNPNGSVNEGETGGGNPLNYINPNDIESIEILKDADATAIYGSRAANGALLITTKKGKAGQTKVDLDFQKGWGKVASKLDLLNTEQYLGMRHEALSNDGLTQGASDYDLTLWDTTRFTDWQKELMGKTANYTDVRSSVSGGTANTQFLIGAGFHKETTVFPGDLDNKKGSVHFSINNTSANQKFHIQLTGNYLYDDNNIIASDLTSTALTLPPNAPSLYNTDGSLNWALTSSGASSWLNPVAYLLNKYKSKTTNLISNAIVSYQLIPGLDVKSSFGYTSLNSDEVVVSPLSSLPPELQSASARSSQFAYNHINSWIIEPQISYLKKFNKSNLQALFGGTMLGQNSNGQRLLATGFNSDLVMEDIKSAATITTPFASVAATYKYNAFFGRLNYNWDGKYIINVTGRRDGSSRFGSANKFHNFGSVGAAWIFSSEKFISKNLSFISFGKLRGSYGTTGNDQIGDYQFLNLYVPPFNAGVPYQGATGIGANRLLNPSFQWEETKKLQVGIDIGLLKDRVTLTSNYFNNRSSNQLLQYNLAIVSGFRSILRNFPATIENSGWEFTVTTQNFKGRLFEWTSTLNVTVPKNRLVAFPNIESSPYANTLKVGEPVTVIKVYHFAGVNSTNGIYEFGDNKGDLTSRPDTAMIANQTIYVNTSPTLYGGFENTFKVQRFELSIFFQIVKQKGPNNLFGNLPGYFFGGPYGTNGNQPATVLNRWRKQGDVAPVQKFTTYPGMYADEYNDAVTSDAAYTDLSYIRLKNLSLSWQMPQSWMRMTHMRNGQLYLHAQNLLTITKYKGLDPETINSLPPLKVLMMGIRLGF